MDDYPIGATYKDWQAIANRRLELLRDANEDNTNGYLTTGKCPFCEMLWYDGWHHHVDCRLAKELERCKDGL